VLNIQVLDIQICLQNFLLPSLFLSQCKTFDSLSQSQMGLDLDIPMQIGLRTEIRQKMCSTLTGITHLDQYLQCQLIQKALLCIKLIYPNLDWVA
jgi:hypothetical protein